MAETYYSAQMTDLLASPSKRLGPQNAGGRVRHKKWTYTTPTATVAVNDLIQLVLVEAGAMIIGGRASWEAMSSAGGTSQVQIGTAATADRYLGTTSVDAAGGTDFANTIALNWLDVLESDTILIAKAVGEAWAAAKKFQGIVYYIVD